MSAGSLAFRLLAPFLSIDLVLFAAEGLLRLALVAFLRRQPARGGDLLERARSLNHAAVDDYLDNRWVRDVLTYGRSAAGSANRGVGQGTKKRPPRFANSM